jgi:hypothetical protein
LSQLRFLPRIIPDNCSNENTLEVFSEHFCGHASRSALIICALLILSSCEKKESGVVDSVGTAPLITQIALSPSLINSDTINVGSNRQPDDVLTITTTLAAHVQASTSLPISVTYTVTSSDSLNIVSSGTLLDDGQVPDLAKGDGLFSGQATFQIRRVQVGTYAVEVIAESDNAYRSNALITPLTVFRGNHAPTISDLVGPDTIKLGNQSQVLLLTVNARDADGLTDVARVVFNSYKPDGSASGGNPFLMYDDGLLDAHGDEKPGDGIFSLLVKLPSNTQLGTYRFEFQAFDRSNEPSNILILRITVIS